MAAGAGATGCGGDVRTRVPVGHDSDAVAESDRAARTPQHRGRCWVRSRPTRPRLGESAVGPRVASPRLATSSPAGAATTEHDPMALECGAMAPSDVALGTSFLCAMGCRQVVELQNLVFYDGFIEVCIVTLNY